MIIEQMQVTAMAVYAYLVVDEDTKEAVLIDPAGGFETINRAIETHGATIRYVINTHGHFDHTSGNDYFVKHTGASLLIHEGDVSKLSAFTSKILSRFMGGKGSPEPAMSLKEGDVISFGNSSLTVMHTPGHSPGSICLHSEGNIFTGDTLFTEGMGRTDFGDGSYEEIMNSIKNKILALDEATVIWPGHNYGARPTSTVAEQRILYMGM